MLYPYQSLNQVTIVGRLGAAPKSIETKTRTSMISFSVATEFSSKNKEGQWERQTTWVPITMFGKQAEKYLTLLAKGDTVLICGRIVTREYTDKNGAKRSSIDLAVDMLQRLSSSAAKSAAPKAQAPAAVPEDELDDLP